MPDKEMPDGYRIYRSTDGTNFTQVAQLVNPVLLPGGFFWDDTNLSHGTKYWYRVRPFTFAAGNGHTTDKHWSVTVLPAPTNVVSTLTGQGAVELTWEHAAVGVQSCRILADFGSGFVFVDSVSPTANSYRFESGAPGTVRLAVVADGAATSSSIVPSPQTHELVASTCCTVLSGGASSWPGVAVTGFPSNNIDGFGHIGSLTLGGLPDHTQVFVALHASNSGAMRVLVDGQEHRVIPPFSEGGVTEVGLLFWHVGSSMTLTFEHIAVEGVAGGLAYAYYYVANAEVRRPSIAVNATQDGSEDPTGSSTSTTPVKFRVQSIAGAELRPGSTVRWRLVKRAEGDAEPGDFQSGSGTATVDENAVAEIVLTPKDDERVEPNERVCVEVVNSGLERWLVGPQGGSGEALLRDNDLEITGFRLKLGGQGVRRDTGEEYDAFQWLDIEGGPGGTKDGKHDGRPDGPGWPVSYRRSLPAEETKISANLAISVKAANAEAGEWHIVGERAGARVFDSPLAPAAAGAMAWTMTNVDTRALTALPATIDSSLWEIDWRVERRVEGRHPRPFVYGKTKNQLYVTGAAADRKHETVLHLACEGAKGKRPRNPGEAEADALAHDREVVDGVWSMFSGRSTKRVDGTEMKYTHLDGLATGEPYGMTSAEMLKHTLGLGQCTAWADLLVNSVAAHGVAATSVRINPRRADGDAPLGYRLKTKAMKAQGTGANLYAEDVFNFHQVVKVAVFPESVFDPSYGSCSSAGAGTSAEVQYERDSLIGFHFLNVVANQYQIRPDRADKRDCVWGSLDPEPDDE